MQPVQVKLYGLVSLTRRRYLTQATIAVGLAVVLLLGWWWKWPDLREQVRGLSSPTLERFVVVGDVLPWLLAGLLALQVIEIGVVLRLFARKAAAAGPGPVGQPGPPDAQRM